MPKPQTKSISIDRIHTNGGSQMRVRLDPQTVNDYAEAFAAGQTLPNIEVYFDGHQYWLADGFHRLEAMRRNRKARISVTVYKGTKEDAIWHAIGANKTHGLPRSNEDKDKAVVGALTHPKGAEMTDSAIAEHVGVSQPFVGKIRKRLETKGSLKTVISRKGKDGRTINTSKIGKKHTSAPPAPKPEPPPEPAEPEQYVCAECGGPIGEDADGEYCLKCKAPIEDEPPVEAVEPSRRAKPLPKPLPPAKRRDVEELARELRRMLSKPALQVSTLDARLAAQKLCKILEV